jgi:ribosomal protein S18 acetylase RimI-like enzyme
MFEVVNIDIQDNHTVKQIDALYQQVWKESIEKRIIKHSQYEGFIGKVMYSDEHEMIGFAYGYSSSPDQYYHNVIKSNLERDLYEEWLKNCFEFVELAVSPKFRGQGHAQLLMEEILKNTDKQNAVLTTQYENIPPQNLYKKSGWKILKNDFMIAPNRTRYVIMVKRLGDEGY